MADPATAGTRQALGALRGALLSTDTVSTVADAWAVLRGVAAERGIPPGTFNIGDVARAVGQINDVIRSRAALNSAPADQLIRSNMLAANPGRTPPPGPETMPRFLVTYQVEYSAMGFTDTQYLTSEFVGGLPSTVGDLLAATTTDATAALTEYELLDGGAVSGVSDLTILQM